MQNVMRELLTLPPYTDDDALTFTAVGGPATISLNIAKGAPVTSGLMFRSELTDWNWDVYIPNSSLELNEGESIQFKNTEEQLSLDNKNNYVQFVMTGTLKAEGTVMSLLNYSPVVSDYAFGYLFRDCTSLVQAPKITASKIGTGGCGGMFRNTRIKDAPKLPAKSIGELAYNSMFYQCSDLSGASDLPAKTIRTNSYGSMYRDCTSLVKPPKILANELVGEKQMTRMFENCTALSSSPELFSTTLANSCYYRMFYNCTNLIDVSPIHAEYQAPSACQSMFWQCTSLSAAPELYSTHLAKHCYYWMFENCSSLIIPCELPATTLAPYCYQHMFTNCVNLQYAPELRAMEIPQGAYSVMFKNTGIKDMPKIHATTIGVNGCYSMFCFCDSLTGVMDTLPGETIYNGAYSELFYGCTALKMSPIIPNATILYSPPGSGDYNLGAYDEMFRGCTSLSSITAEFETWNDFDTNDWVINVPSGGNFYCPATLSGEYGNSRIPNGWNKIDI